MFNEKTIEAAIKLSEGQLLKYEGKFKVGDIIKAWDFKKMNLKGYPDRYVIGKIIETTMNHGAKVFVIKCQNDSGKNSGGRVGELVYVPMQVVPGEYDGRITKVK